MGGEIKTITVKRDTLGDFWLFFATDEEIKLVEVRSGESVGLDFNLKKFLTTLEGEHIESLQFMRQASGKIKRLSTVRKKAVTGIRRD
jgi:putative transposase